MKVHARSGPGAIYGKELNGMEFEKNDGNNIDSI